MKITREKYEKLRDMDLIDRSKYSLNDRVEMIVQEVQDFLEQCEKRAREMLGYENKEKYNEQEENY